MSKSITFKKLAMCSMTTAALVVASQGAFAHTRLETPVAIEGVKIHNSANISHGCPPSTARKPTYGTIVLFPNNVDYVPVIGVDSTSGNAASKTALFPTGNLVQLGKGTAKVFTTNPLSTYITTPLASLGSLIHNGGPFPSENIKVDSKNNIIGFWAGGKAYDQTVSTIIQTDFSTPAISIVPKSCARSVTFALAIADVCDASVPSATAKDEEVLYWSPIPNFAGVPGQPFGATVADATRSIPTGPAYSKFDGYADTAHTIAGDGWGSPATLTIVRNLNTNPLPTTGCTGNGGFGDDVYVYPDAKQINDHMPVWSGIHKGEGTNYWN